MKIEIEHEGSCLGATGRTRRADRPRRPGERPFRRCPGSLEGPRPEIVQVDAHYAVELSSIVDFQKGYSRGESAGAGFGVGTQ